MVSGAASGIGRHLAHKLLQLGHRVMALDIDREGLERFVKEHAEYQERLSWRVLDVRDAKGWNDAVDSTVTRFGHLDFMLNVAGFLKPGYVHEVTPELLAQHIDINTKGAMLATQAGARHMVVQGSGHVINIASIAGIAHVPGLAAYAASKHAVRGFSLSVAHELRRHGVYVSVLCPDAVETPMLTAQEEHAEARMTFGGARPLTLVEVERAVLRVMRTRELELIVAVPFSGRALMSRVVNLMPSLARVMMWHVEQRGERIRNERRKASERSKQSHTGNGNGTRTRPRGWIAGLKN
jgi:3-oxoacyl-[acyl-carrier protein] reductase